jgi:outer membrane autotransporter protein
VRILSIKGDFFSKNGIDTFVDGANLNIGGNNSVIKFSYIGTSENKLNSLSVGAKNIDLSGNIFIKALNVNSQKSATISNSSIINDLGNVTILEGLSIQKSSLTINSDSAMSKLETNSNTVIAVDTGKQITINGSDTSTINDTFNFGVDRSNSDKAVILLDLGNLDIADQAILNIDYSKASYLQINDRYNFIQSSAGSITTLGQLNLNDTSFLLFPTVEVTGDSSNNLTLTEEIDSDSTALLSSQDLAITNFILNNHGFRDIDLVRTEILKIPDQPTLEAALHSLLLPNNNALQLTSLSISNQIANIIDYHIQSIDYDNFLKFEKIADKSDKDSKKNRNLWGEVFAGNAKQGAINQQSGFNNKSSGLILGFDHMIEGDNYNHLIGGSFSYDKANVTDQIGSNQKSTINAHQLSFYNSNVKKTGVGIFNDNLIGLSYNNYNTNRAINIVSYHSQAQGKFSGTSYFAKTALGYNFKIGEKILIAPIAAIKYFGLALKDYQEESPSGLGLKVKNSRFKLITLDIGGRIIGQITPKIYSKFTLSLSHNGTVPNPIQTI